MTGHTKEQGSSRIVPILMLVGLVCAVAVAAGLYFAGLGPTESAPESSSPVLITVSSEVLDFGVVQVNGTAARRLVIRNDGDVAVPLQLRTSVDRYDVEPKEVVLQPGSREVVVVTARPDQSGELDDRLNIVAGDGIDAAPLVVSLLGQVDDIRLAQAGDTGRSSLSAGRNSGGTRESEPNATGGSGARQAGTGAAQGGWQADDVGAGSQRANRNDGAVAVAQVGTAGSADGRAPGSDSGTGEKRRSPRRSLDPSRSTSTSVMPVGIAEPPMVVPREITENDKAAARKLPSRTPDLEDLDSLPNDEPAEDRDLRDIDREGDDERDPFDDELEENDGEDEPEEDDDDPFVRPKFVISSASIVGVLGSTNTFYPQELGVIGTDMGGPIAFTQPIQFPLVPLAFGESMQFAQTGMFAGVFDAGTGLVNLQLDMIVVDSDGDGAPISMTLTTGTVYGRNEAGLVEARAGSPRMPGTGFLKLVGIQEIPMGFGNGGEGRLVQVEILGALTFGTQAMPTAQAMGP